MRFFSGKSQISALVRGAQFSALHVTLLSFQDKQRMNLMKSCEPVITYLSEGYKFIPETFSERMMQISI